MLVPVFYLRVLYAQGAAVVPCWMNMSDERRFRFKTGWSEMCDHLVRQLRVRGAETVNDDGDDGNCPLADDELNVVVVVMVYVGVPERAGKSRETCTTSSEEGWGIVRVW